MSTSRETPCIYIIVAVPVAVRSKVWVCCRSTADIVGSNPTEGHGCLSVVSVVCCQVEVSVIKEVHINMCPILDGYGVMTACNLE